MKKKILFVVQRYGLEINGGAELHCRQLAERLVDDYDVSVLTTCAIDYVTWKNEYKEGTEYINDVKIIRKKVDFERNQKNFNKISEKSIALFVNKYLLYLSYISSKLLMI